MTREIPRRRAIVAGIIVIVGLIAAGASLFAIGDRQRLWSGTFSVHVGFERVQGVGVGTSVRVRGLEAGAVAAIDLPASGRPDAPLVLKLDLDRRFSPLLFADATARILSEGMVGGKVIELDPGSPDKGPLKNGAVIASKPPVDLNEVIDQAVAVVDDIKNGKGTLGKVIRDEKVYDELAGTLARTKELMQKSQDAVTAIQQDADAIKKMPLIRGYVENETDLLVRHSGNRYRTVLASNDLFESGRAVLTDAGKSKLDELGPWLTELRYRDSDVVVAAYVDPKSAMSPQVSQTLTVRQSEVVSNYLKDQHSAHKMGWWYRRKVTPIGCGTKPPPVPESESLPASRVEVMVFTP